MHVQKIISHPVLENSYVLWTDKNQQALVVDPGLDPEAILSFLEEQNLELVGILCTHGHVDHIAGNGALKSKFPNAPILIGEGDAEMLTSPEKNLGVMFNLPIVSPPADQLLNEGDVVELAGLRFRILFVPGHSAGHIAFLADVDEANHLFGGDVILPPAIGRTDFPGGDMDTLLASIREKFFTLPDDTILYPGHYEVTTIGDQKQNNQVVGIHAGWQ
ncbi:MAG: MBL fold metallo-hydrolase [Gemmataceae bacterium]